MRRATRSGFLTWLACSAMLLGCNALLGIEDLSSEGGDASAGEMNAGGSGGTGHHADGGPSSSSGGQGGSAGKGGSSAGGDRDGSAAGDSGSGASGGTGGSAGSDSSVPAGGSGGDADSGTPDSGTPDSGTPDSGTPDSGVEPNSPTVHGKVIDYYRNPVPNAAVKIGDATTMTDANGAFTVDDVSATYDAALTITVPHYGATEVAGWLFVGLTRRDPTLQVYRGSPLRSGNVAAMISNVTFPISSDDKIDVAFGGAYGESNLDLDAMLTNTSLDWEGPASVSGTAHALHWTNATASPYLPTVFHASDVHPLGLDESVGASLSLDLHSTAALPTGLISGTVSAPTFAMRTNAVFVRYDDDAATQLVDQYSAPDTYSYLVPSLSNASIVVAATVNTASYTPFAVAYADGVTPGTSNIALTVPSPATPLTPGGGTSNVTPATEFTWSGSDQVYMVRFENVNFYETYYVITTAKSVHIPAPPTTNLPLQANGDYVWSVRTHDTYASVDAATGPDGFLDAYCYGVISGPRRGNGTHTSSASLAFKTAP